jgi:copper chaperone
MTIYHVAGMTCEHCVRAVTEELSKLPGVTDVDVSLETGQVAIAGEGQPDPEAVRAAVEEAGYQLVS